MSWLDGRLFRRFEPRSEFRPNGAAPAAAGVRIRWLGTAGFTIETPSTTVLIDPYLTRAPLATLVASKLEPDELAIRSRLPARVDAVLCGHSHFDHLLDGPRIALLTGAKIVGSATTARIALAHGVAPAQIETVNEQGRELAIGDMHVRYAPSLHAKILFGRVPFPGVVKSAPDGPLRAWQYRMGGAFGIYVRAGEVTLYHNGSADLIDVELDRPADVLLAGIAGYRATPRYLERLIGRLHPAVVVPSHHDAFFSPLEAGAHLLPGIDIDGFVEEVRRLAPSAQIVMPLYDDTMSFDPETRRASL